MRHCGWERGACVCRQPRGGSCQRRTTRALVLSRRRELPASRYGCGLGHSRQRQWHWRIVGRCKPNGCIRRDAERPDPLFLEHRFSLAWIRSAAASGTVPRGTCRAAFRRQCPRAPISPTSSSLVRTTRCSVGGRRIKWATSVLPSPSGAPPYAGLVGTGLMAITPAAGQVEVSAVTRSRRLAHWSFDGADVAAAEFLPSGPIPLTESVPVAIVVDGRTEVFAIGQSPNALSGGPLIRWRRRHGGAWSDAKVIGASLSEGGLGASGARSRTDVFGFGGGGLQHWPAGIRAATNEPWANWANTVRSTPAGHCYPTTEEEVVAVVTTAEKGCRRPGTRRGQQLVAPRHRRAACAAFIVETNGMTGLITHVIDAAVLTEGAPDLRYLVHVEAGIQIEQLMRTLDGLNLGPFTMGGSSGQTLAGVISTSVHGAHWDRGPIPNAVRAIQLVGPGGARYWIEPDQWRITKEDELRRRLGPDVQIRYNDDWFDAVLVSVGSMGIITAVVLEVTDQYFLQRTLTAMPWSELRPRLADGSVFTDPDHYVMVALHPAQTGDRMSYLVTMRRSPDRRTQSPGDSTRCRRSASSTSSRRF